MTTAHRTVRVSKPALGLILAGLFIFHPAYAEITDPTTATTTLDPAATQVTDPAVTFGTTLSVPTTAIVAMPSSDAEPYDPFANSEQPVEIDPALIPPPAQ